MALSADRNTSVRESKLFSYPVAAATTIYAGALVVLDASGNAEPGSAATGKIAVGCAEAFADNSAGAAAAINVSVRQGAFKWSNSGSDAVTKANIGDTVYIEDDATVCATGTGKSAAGIMIDIESDGVWVETRVPSVLTTGLLAANNLSDVGSAATAATNLGVGAASAVTHGSLSLTSTLAVAGNVAVNTNKFTIAAATGNTLVAGTFDVTGAAALASTLGVTGDVAINTNKFTITAASGNTAIAGTLGVTGDVAINTNKFTITAASGNTAIAGSLSVTSDVAINTNKFNVTAASGNTAIAGTLGVTGDVAINTNKFTITAASGNTAIAGNLAVAGSASKVIGTVGLDFNTCRVHDNLAALLPVAGASDDLGNVPGTVGTTAPSLQTEDLKAAGATNNLAAFSLVVPDWYTAGSTLALVCNAGMITTVADTSATLDVECWVPDYANADGTVSADLCATAAQSINSTTFADKSFTISDAVAGHEIAAGSVLQFRITTAVNDGATVTAVIAAIRKIHLAVSA